MTPAPNTPQPRILILDDQPEVREALRLILKHEGMQTEIAETSDQALDLAQRHNFDVILSDISHPGLSGLELLPIWKQTCPNVPIVIISASISSNLERAIGLGAFACVSKPFNGEAVLTSVRAALRS